MVHPFGPELVRLAETERRTHIRRAQPRPLSARAEVARLRRLDVFAGSSRRSIRAALRLGTRITVPAGQVLAGEGSGAQAAILLDGVVAQRGKASPDRILTPGEQLGLSELVAGTPAAAAMALTRAELLVFGRREAIGLLLAAPELGRRLLGGPLNPLPRPARRSVLARSSLAP